jgi:hypothetical protein
LPDPNPVNEKVAVNGTDNKSIASIDNGIPYKGGELQTVLH